MTMITYSNIVLVFVIVVVGSYLPESFIPENSDIVFAQIVGLLCGGSEVQYFMIVLCGSESDSCYGSWR